MPPRYCVSCDRDALQGVINDPQDTIKETIGISTNTFALIVAVFAIGGAIGTPLAGKVRPPAGTRLACGWWLTVRCAGVNMGVGG